MWLVGVLSLMILVGGTVGWLNRFHFSAASAGEWDLESLSTAYAGIIAPLAGFSVAAAVFLANLTRVAQTPFFADVMALFLIAFIMLMGTAVMFATFRSAKLGAQSGDDHLTVHHMLYVVCNLGFYLGLSLSWLGLRPLLLSIGLSDLASVFTWVLLFSLLAGATRIGAWLHTLLGVGPLVSFSIPLLSMAAAIVYGLTLAPRYPVLWPAANPVLSLAVLVFAVGAVGFAVETTMITLHGRPGTHRRLRRIGSIFFVPYLSAGITAISLLWVSIASA